MKPPFYVLLVSSWLFLTGCQTNLLDKSLSPAGTTGSFSTAIFQIDGWQVDTVYKGADYKGYLTHFASESVGYLVCTNYPEVLKTTDGGRNWITQSIPIQAGTASPTGIDFVDEQTGFITFQDIKGCPNNCQTRQSLIKTRDGGETWTLVQTTEKGVLADPHFTSPSEGVASLSVLIHSGQGISSRRNVVRTTDGGVSWQPIPDVVIGQSINDVFYANRQVGFIKSSNRQLYRTLDSGRSWQLMDGLLPTGSESAPVVFYDALLGYIAANAGCYRTTDGGKSWQVLWQGTTGVVGIISSSEQLFLRTTKVYNYGDYFEYERELRQTTDGGQTFKSYPSVYRLTVPFIRFVSNRVGYGTLGNKLLRFSRR